ncbi:MAG: acetate--CoA ligase family protein [Chloroflexota bacterium]|nr:acetate--CoA ligase family protein [Chloroflexota bacterium]
MTTASLVANAHADEQVRRLDPLLRPCSIAVVGASPNPSFVSMTLKNLLRHGYAGEVVAINPRYDQVEGARCYPSLLEVPHPVDLAVVGVAARWLPPLLEQCEQKRVGALEVITSGFAETGQEGAQRQRELCAWAERAGIVVGGPNCLGLMHAPSGMVALPTVFPNVVAGQVGLVLQSGMMAPTLLLPLFARGIGVSFVVTSGNEAAVEAADYIRYLVEDEQTRVIGVFAEAIKTPARFIDACRLAAERRKPIVMLKIGRSDAARRAALAHTGSLVGSDDVIGAVLEKLGVARVDSVDALLEHLAVFHSPRLPRGPGVAAVIVSGGAAGLLSDLGQQSHVELPPLPEATVSALRDVVPEFGSVGNPLDVTGQAVFQTEILARSLDLLAEAPGIDTVIYARAYPSWLDRVSPVGRILEDAIARYPQTVFLTLSLVGGHFHPSASPDVPLAEPVTELGGTPFLQGAEYGLQAITSLVRYAEFLRSRAPAAPTERPQRLPPRMPPPGQADARAMLAAYGIPVARERPATSLAEALAAAAEIGYPVAMKLEAHGLLHKTDVGAVVLDVRDEVALQVAFARLMALGIAETRGVLVQEMVSPGVELMLGMKRDPQFGPVLAIGMGGIFVEVLRDIQLLLPPVSAAEARRALERLRGAALLRGARGRPPADLEALIRAIMQFSALCQDLGDAVDEIDVNPLIALADGVCAVDCLIVPGREERTTHGIA